MISPQESPWWMRPLLMAAGVYNLVWGALVVLFPLVFFRAVAMEAPRYPQIWQCVGMIVGVYGVGYLIAARDPLRHWPIVLVGLLGKIFGPIGFLSAAQAGELPWAAGATIVTNDLIWWAPFGAILYHAFRFHSNTSIDSDAIDLSTAISSIPTQRGATLAELSSTGPLLVVFLRHTGCEFCRQALADLAKTRRQLESAGVQLALVHMGPPMHATQLFAGHGLDDVHRLSDPHCRLYRAFGFERASFGHLFGPRIWLPALRGILVDRHGFGPIVGDGFRSHGAIVLRDGQVVAQFQPQNAADAPDYVHFACSASEPSGHMEADPADLASLTR